jgi:hypothetical protein
LAGIFYFPVMLASLILLPFVIGLLLVKHRLESIPNEKDQYSDMNEKTVIQD